MRQQGPGRCSASRRSPNVVLREQDGLRICAAKRQRSCRCARPSHALDSGHAGAVVRVQRGFRLLQRPDLRRQRVQGPRGQVLRGLDALALLYQPRLLLLQGRQLHVKGRRSGRASRGVTCKSQGVSFDSVELPLYMACRSALACERTSSIAGAAADASASALDTRDCISAQG